MAKVRILALLCGVSAFYSPPRRALVRNTLRLASADDWLSASSERMDALDALEQVCEGLPRVLGSAAEDRHILALCFVSRAHIDELGTVAAALDARLPEARSTVVVAALATTNSRSRYPMFKASALPWPLTRSASFLLNSIPFSRASLSRSPPPVHPAGVPQAERSIAPA